MEAKSFTKRAPGRLVRTSHKCCAFVPDPLPKQLEPPRQIRDANEKALLALGELRAIIPSLPNPALLTQPFMRREAVLSSKIEGTRTEIEQLYLFETEERSRGHRDLGGDPDAHEVLNYVRALEHGLKALSDIPVCNRLLRSMHRILLDSVAEDRGKYKSPGEFRNVQAYIGSEDIHTARYVAPPESRVADLMGQLEEYINSQDLDLPTLVKIALVHYQFEAIHPFSDGNGRLGRLLISLMLASSGILKEPLLYLSAFFERHKSEYVTHLWEVSRAAAWEEWVLFFLKGVTEESADAVNRAARLRNLREEYRGKLQRSRGAASAMELVDRLFHWPVIDIREAARILNMTYKGAQKNVEKLVEHEILTELTGRIRNKLYCAKSIIRVVS